MREVIRKFVLMLTAWAALGVGSPATAQAAPDPTGPWHGTLKTPRGDLTLVITITRGEDGTLEAELRSPDQDPGGKIAATAIAVRDGELSFAVAPLSASYKGHWMPAEQAWEGTFTQGADLPLKLERGLPAPKPVVQGLDGTWNGKITMNGVDLRLVLHILTGDNGTAISLDSPDQLANGLPVQDLSRDGQAVRFRLNAAGSAFAGTLSDDGRTLSGSWQQGPNSYPISFARSDTTASREPPKRPQMPTPPFPYASEDVAFDNPRAADVHLAGTLTRPEGAGPFPAAILITGSGQQDRDETLLGHKPFLVIADYLTRHGIAVLRVDDRGVGGSKGPITAATSADFATDANAAFAYLRTRKAIRQDAIGFIGHSEGGMIGPIAMADNKDVAFLVMLAGPGTALDELLISQRRLIGATMGMSEEQMDKAEPVMRALFKAIASGDSYDQGREAALKVLTPEAMTAIGAPPGTDKQLILAQIGSPWFRYFFQYDPAINLRKIRVPVLALNGSLDRQVPAKENIPAIKAALRNDPDATVVEMPGLNHLFQTAKTGAVGEYAEIEETIAPQVLAMMADWINERFGTK